MNGGRIEERKDGREEGEREIEKKEEICEGREREKDGKEVRREKE